MSVLVGRGCLYQERDIRLEKKPVMIELPDSQLSLDKKYLRDRNKEINQRCF